MARGASGDFYNEAHFLGGERSADPGILDGYNHRQRERGKVGRWTVHYNRTLYKDDGEYRDPIHWIVNW